MLEWSATATPPSMLELPSVAVMEDGAGEELAEQLTDVDTVVVRNASGSSAGEPAVLGASPLASFAALPPGVRLGRLVTEELLADGAAALRHLDGGGRGGGRHPRRAAAPRRPRLHAPPARSSGRMPPSRRRGRPWRTACTPSRPTRSSCAS